LDFCVTSQSWQNFRRASSIEPTLAVEGELALAYYRPEEGRLVLTHTEVPQRLSGRGIGSRLAEGVFAAIRASGRKAVVKCPFMAAYAARHPNVADIIEK
jgi:predicted GNAT family acetyltransferase